MCAHTWKFAGRAAVELPNCKRPTLLVCSSCAEESLRRCKRGRSSQCPPCADTYRRRVREVAISGSVGTSSLFLTVTAPSSSARPHFHRGAVCPCYTGPVDLARWNASLGGQRGRWNRLLQDLRRTFGPLEYFASKEVQERGALHLHVLVRRPDGGRLVVRTSTLRRLAIKHGFGHEVDVQVVKDSRAASYVSKYVSKACDLRASVPWRNASGCVHRHRSPARREACLNRNNGKRLFVAPYRTWSSSRGWGVTVKHLRAASCVFAASRGALVLVSLDSGEVRQPRSGPLLADGAFLSP